MMVWIYSKRFPHGTVKDLYVRNVRLFKVLKKLNYNVYVIDPEDYGIGHTFDVENLIDYKSSDFNPNNPLVDETYPEPFSKASHFPHS